MAGLDFPIEEIEFDLIKYFLISTAPNGAVEFFMPFFANSDHIEIVTISRLREKNGCIIGKSTKVRNGKRRRYHRETRARA